jgi:glycosyltransferase involved in cell wall biosynthesis
MKSRTRICFFARVRSRAELETVEFYAQDIRALEELGYEVHKAIRPSELRSADLYFVWWWTWAFLPTAFAALLRRPVIVTGVFDFWLYPKRSRPHRLLHRYALRSADANVFISRLEYEEVPEHLPVHNAQYIPLAIDTEIYRLGRTPRDEMVLTTAKMAHGNGVRKCIEEIIRSAPLVRKERPNVQFVLAGEPDQTYLDLVRALGAEEYVKFPGLVDHDTKVALMQRCQIYLQPTRFEGFGLAIAEAMACGAPVVTSAVGAVPEVVGDAAVFVDGESSSKIAAGVVRLLNDRALQMELSLRGRQRIESEFSFERHKAQWAAVIESVL